MLTKSIAVLLGLAANALAADTGLTPNSIDPSSYANTLELRTTHFQLDLTVDFDKSMLTGTVLHTLHVLERSSRLVLDTMKLDIKNAYLVTYDAKHKATMKKLTFTIEQPNENLGSVCVIHFTEALMAGTTAYVQVEYATSPEATGLNWLTKEQTQTKKMPYLFSQFEPIYARSMIPLQDTPSNKATYAANITVNVGPKVFMSANSTGSTMSKDKKTETFHFVNDIKMASYLVAIAVGNIAYESVGRRTGVVSEVGLMLDTTKRIYGDDVKGIEHALDLMEDYLTPYIWGNYTLLVLPPTFPYGGMENPLLTFASPTTIMTDDTSQTYVATHEIAHSWTGNEVTCANWSNMWLNEGFTVFEERHVSGEIYSEEFAKVEMLLGTFDVAADYARFGDSSFTSLNPQFNGANPDNSFSTVPYEKGFSFLYMNQQLFEANHLATYTKDVMQEFLRGWILHKKEMSATQEQLRVYWNDFLDKKEIFSAANKKAITDAVDWETWMNAPGPVSESLTKTYFNYVTPDSQDAYDLADEYVNLQGHDSPFNLRGYNSWYPNKQVLFVDRLQEHSDKGQMTVGIIQRIDADLNVTGTIQPEVMQRWFPLGIEHDYMPVFDPAHKFISEQGRMKYLNPIYTNLVQNGYRNTAFQWYSENEKFYHPIARATLKSILSLEMGLEDEMALQKHNAYKGFLKE